MQRKYYTKRQQIEGGKVYVNYATGKGLISRIHKEFKELNNKTNNTIKKWAKDMNSSGDYYTMKNKWPTNTWGNSSESLAIREMQMKTKVRFHFIAVRISITQKSKSNKCWWGYWRKGILIHPWWECKQVQPLWKTVRKAHGLKWIYHMTQLFHFWKFTQMKINQQFIVKVPLCLLQLNSQWLIYEINPEHHQLVAGQSKCDKCMVWILLCHKTEWNSEIKYSWYKIQKKV